MKLTWFAGSTFRIHIGGAILVCDPDGAPAGIEVAELVSGADRLVRLDDPAIADVDAQRWAPRRVGAMIAETAGGLALHRVAGGLIVETPGESPLAIAMAPLSAAGRWSRDAVVLACGPDAVAVAASALERWGPRLIALAAGEAELDAAFASFAGRLGDTGLVALEPGLALEV